MANRRRGQRYFCDWTALQKEEYVTDDQMVKWDWNRIAQTVPARNVEITQRFFDDCCGEDENPLNFAGHLGHAATRLLACLRKCSPEARMNFAKALDVIESEATGETSA